MQTYIDILLLSLIIIYIVDLSGFTQSWRRLLSTTLRIKALKPLPPFDCGQCMTWWTCLLYTLVTGEITMATTAFIALLSFLSIPLGQFFIYIKEALISLANKLLDKC